MSGAAGDEGVGLGPCARWGNGPPAEVAVVLTNLLQVYALWTDQARSDARRAGAINTVAQIGRAAIGFG